jgi:hypothetical protein
VACNPSALSLLIYNLILLFWNTAIGNSPKARAVGTSANARISTPRTVPRGQQLVEDSLPKPSMHNPSQIAWFQHRFSFFLIQHMRPNFDWRTTIRGPTILALRLVGITLRHKITEMIRNFNS